MTTDAERRETTIRIRVPEMDCPSCAGKVETSVSTLSGIVEFEPQVTTGTVTVTYDPTTTDRNTIESRVEAAGYDVVREPADETITFDVPEMDCPSCAGKVENALGETDGVASFETAPTTGTVEVTVDSDGETAEGIVAAIESAGYEVVGSSQSEGSPTRQDTWTSPRALKAYAGGVLLAAGLGVQYALTGLDVSLLSTPISLTVADVLFLVAAALGGQDILRNGYYSATNLSLDIDFLMSAAIVSAVTATVISPSAHLYSEAATLAVLFSVAELLERYSMEQARNSLRELMELSPDEATVRRGGEETTVPVEDVAVGEVVVVKPGEKVPLDGVVRSGQSAVNEAPITGESVPVDKTTDDEVYAGSINEEGYLEVEVTSVAGTDTLSQIVDLVEDAQSEQTEREQFVERFAGYYTPVMVAVAVGVAVIPPLAFGWPWVEWFVAGITMLVLACPCAFVISTPVTVVSGITSAARNGVLIKGGSHLEAMGRVDAIALDKTGTLTRGELAVTDVVPLNGHTEAEVLQCARGLERRSEHPIGEAIVAHADDAAVSDREVAEFESLTGKGVQATLDGRPHYAGKPALFDDLGFDLEHVHVVADGGALETEVRGHCDRAGCLNLVEDTIPRLQAEGKTVVLVGTEDELEGIVAVADEVRPGAAETVAALRKAGVEVVMLTGDNEGTARAIAEQVGIDEYRAGLLPEDKVGAIEELQSEYGEVAMVGDGINDAPALATADVGVAMGAAGTDTAIETADVALLADDISKLPYLYDLSHGANGIIRQNIWASLGIKLLLAVGVPLGYVSVALAVLAGDAGMTLGVTGNAMRLSRLRPE
ncbi:heavy metal translocating P-type ATPase [Haloarculaceae archaeon H-GB1-1]|nr:heavy metal translocating P-type ATPase [Haloarculaceae archaeon H-GB1-1]